MSPSPPPRREHAGAVEPCCSPENLEQLDLKPLAVRLAKCGRAPGASLSASFLSMPAARGAASACMWSCDGRGRDAPFDDQPTSARSAPLAALRGASLAAPRLSKLAALAGLSESAAAQLAAVSRMRRVYGRQGSGGGGGGGGGDRPQVRRCCSSVGAYPHASTPTCSASGSRHLRHQASSLLPPQRSPPPPQQQQLQQQQRHGELKVRTPTSLSGDGGGGGGGHLRTFPECGLSQLLTSLRNKNNPTQRHRRSDGNHATIPSSAPQLLEDGGSDGMCSCPGFSRFAATAGRLGVLPATVTVSESQSSEMVCAASELEVSSDDDGGSQLTGWL